MIIKNLVCLLKQSQKGLQCVAMLVGLNMQCLHQCSVFPGVCARNDDSPSSYPQSHTPLLCRYRIYFKSIKRLIKLSSHKESREKTPHSSSRLMKEYLFCCQQTRFFHRLLAAYSSNCSYSSENHSNRCYSNNEEVDTSFCYFFLEVEFFSKHSDFLCPKLSSS